MAPRFVDTLGLDFLLSFEVDGRQHAIAGMFTFRVVEHLDVIEHIPSGVFA